MTITVQWDDCEQTILRREISRVWQWDALLTSIHEGHRMIDATAHQQRVYTILVISPEINSAPSGVVLKWRQLDQFRHPRTDLVVVVSERSVVRAFITIIRRISPAFRDRYAYASTLDEARDHIQAVRAQHPTMNP